MQQEPSSKPSDPSNAMLFIFSMITFLFFCAFMGVFKGSTDLMMGAVQLGCFPAYFAGALIYVKRGETLNGAVYLIFATLFGAIGGLANVAVHFSNVFGWGVDTAVTNLTLLWGGVALIPVCVANRRWPVIPLSVYVGACVFLIVYSLYALGWVGGIFGLIKVLAGYVAFSGFYSCLSGILTDGGSKGLPLGPSLFK